MGPNKLPIRFSIEEVTDDAEETFCATSTDWALLDEETGGVTSGSGSLLVGFEIICKETNNELQG